MTANAYPAMPSLFRRLYYSPEPSWQEALAEIAYALGAAALAKGRFQEAREVALSWAEKISDHLGLEPTDNWKFFKRSLVSRWFGEVERRKFPENWDTSNVVQYATSLLDRNIRVSIFPPDIACHAVSFQILAGDASRLISTIAGLDRAIPIEVFPESSNERTICFRRFATQFAETVFYEAGSGQAMLLFESEQGRHPIVRATKADDRFFYSCHRDSQRVKPCKIFERLQTLIEVHEGDLARKSFGMCRSLGIETLAIEGYYEAMADRLVVVDIDLPLDLVFMPP